jgi:hypothetical protein
MKRVLGFLGVVLLLGLLVTAQETTSAGQTSITELSPTSATNAPSPESTTPTDVAKSTTEANPYQTSVEEDYALAQELSESVPIDENGKFDESRLLKNKRLLEYKSKAEERIKKINDWLDNNVAWLKYVFHMKPEISWLFFANLYFILWGVLIFLINFRSTIFFIGKDLYAFLVGAAIFLALLSVGVFLGIANALVTWVSYIWNVLIPSGFLLALLVLIVIIVLLIFAYPVLIAIFRAMRAYFRAKKEFKKQMQVAANQGKLDAYMGEVMGKAPGNI